jgi:hypothetical protein
LALIENEDIDEGREFTEVRIAVAGNDVGNRTRLQQQKGSRIENLFLFFRSEEENENVGKIM